MFGFIFSEFWFAQSFSSTCSGFMHDAPWTLQELRQLLWCFKNWPSNLSWNVIIAHLQNSSNKVYLCSQVGKVSSQLACHSLNSAKKHGITLIPTYKTTRGRLVQKGSSSSCPSSSFPASGLTRSGFVGVDRYQSLSALLYAGNAANIQELWVWIFVAIHMTIRFRLAMLSPFCISSTISVQCFSCKCDRSVQTSNKGGTLLDESILPTKCSRHVGRYPVLHHDERFHQGGFSQIAAQGSAVTAFDPFATHEKYVLLTGDLFISISGSVMGN